MGESTLQWPPLGCHILLFFKGVHVWIYPIPNFWKNFITFLNIMLEYTLGKILKLKNYFISFYKGKDWNIFVKTNAMYLCTQKHKYTPK
jgi:hypothetical protein